MFIVEIEHGVWMAPWGGVLGCTLVVGNAKVFTSVAAAKRALTNARKYHPHAKFADAKILPEPAS